MIIFTRRTVFNLIISGLFLVSAGFLTLVSRHVHPQASMDSAYYHVMVGQLERGAGFTEPFVWNYLNGLTSLEHPMNYWMPLGIIFYYLARMLFGVAGEVWLNIFLWSLLAVMVFAEVRKATDSLACSGFAYFTMLFCGRNLFYLLTTDNIVFYALFGFLFFRLLAAEKTKWPMLALVAGLVALMRIEGIIIAFSGAIFVFYKDRRMKVILGYLCVLLLVLMPWMMRNYSVFGHPWPSNSKSLFLQEYSDLFSPDFTGTLQSYLESGWQKIIAQKAYGFWVSLLNLVAVPGMFILYPLWLVGLPKSWGGAGRFFVALLLMFLFLCGFVFTLQSERGTAMHISAFFYPGFAVLNGLGLFALVRHFELTKKAVMLVLSGLMVWVSIFSFMGVSALNESYAKTYDPYMELLAQHKMPEDVVVASIEPVYLNYLTGARGIVIPKNDSSWLDKIRQYGCNVIIMDNRSERNNFSPDDEGNWIKAYSSRYLTLYQRAKP